jgi:hypothetical protein
VTQERIAEARCKIDMARLLTLKAAWLMDVAGNKVAKTEIAMIKVVAPSMACQVIDWAMQVHGGGGMSDDFPLAYAYAGARTLRFADGPDEVHRNAIAKWASTAPTAVMRPCPSPVEADWKSPQRPLGPFPLLSRTTRGREPHPTRLGDPCAGHWLAACQRHSLREHIAEHTTGPQAPLCVFFGAGAGWNATG